MEVVTEREAMTSKQTKTKPTVKPKEVVRSRAEAATAETLIAEQDIRARERENTKSSIPHAFGSCTPMGECTCHE